MLRRVCPADTGIVCSKPGCEAASDITPAQSDASTEGEGPANSRRGGAKSRSHREQQFAFSRSKNAADTRYPSANRSSDEDNSFTCTVPKATGNSSTGSARSYGKAARPLKNSG